MAIAPLFIAPWLPFAMTNPEDHDKPLFALARKDINEALWLAMTPHERENEDKEDEEAAIRAKIRADLERQRCHHENPFVPMRTLIFAAFAMGFMAGILTMLIFG